jgi:hypothetical protein
MRKDQIFVLLLIVILPLSGCVDGAIGDADAQDSTESNGTNIVNNYYNNTTLSNNQFDYKYLSFDEELENGNWNNTINPWSHQPQSSYVLMGSFNTTGGSLFSVIYSANACEQTSGWTSSTNDCRFAIQSTCGDVVIPYQYFPSITSETTSYMLSGTAASNCTHTVYSGTSIDQLDSNDYIRLHYEIGFKQIPISPY